jgi:energy-converting hydrogenase Eha subunit B
MYVEDFVSDLAGWFVGTFVSCLAGAFVGCLLGTRPGYSLGDVEGDEEVIEGKNALGILAGEHDAYARLGSALHTG